MQRDLSSPELWAESLRASQERRIQRARRESRERIGRRGTAVALCGLAVMSGGAFAHDSAAPERAPVTSVYLDRGDRGAEVRALQQALEVSADGIFGPQTERSVRAFQRRNGLQVDGIAGPVTLGALGLGGGSSTGAPSGSQGTATPNEEPAIEEQTTEKPAAKSEPEQTTEKPAAKSVPEPATEETAPEATAKPAPEPEPKPAAEEPKPASDGPSAELQAIAQCESGGNPGAVSSTGQYRGKYQFSRETWRGVGGEGDPAAAPESEQDRRAADLYEQSGSSPWPSCG